ncbi:RdgB/HAM1 family non-canonical purine NTP pyrophosphatase [Paucibacter sp. DJ2R-2]|uniref:RdgB/HAM1 family non-canonical purine NTP pyrophosphatase n=1 Tax=Paucibacter sp. DJ2R-2 TaxID=2893558 RepID=UPI0021E40D1E|nr:RdgB/HAM1 family non-canonical purine NTP pyrophosphatase [Paucibacter sp. DJ2R-2]MCV2422638.1 RdgB/HAM1 family non-canonical purine NTP pyrophosphatase [Paucibacter sp. DJ4R-1]MCV2438836.1 RdgB/HAM1 family non-canonical purine NTP pyrophosphatase [Paucibacter sp. DJ2R-2]
MKIVLASNNAKKLIELQALFAPLGVELLTQGSLGISEAEEPFGTFAENALAKARHAAEASGLPALADDSGLAVEALAGAPGVLSARYATLFGQPKSDADNNRVLLEQMAQFPASEQRAARFVCALVAVRSARDPEPLIAMGRWQGQILSAAQGDAGFGYDPLMFIPSLGRSVAELSAAEKNVQSHRALAAANLAVQMREVWHLG